MKALLPLFFLFASCVSNESKLENLEAFIFKEWATASKIEVTYPEVFYPSKSITSPQMVWKNLLKVHLGKRAHCLFYRVPHNRLSKGRGILKIVEIPVFQKCVRLLEKKELFLINGLSHLKLYFTSKPEKNLKTKNEYKAFHLYLSASKEGDKDRAIVFPLINIERKNLINPNKLNQKVVEFKKYDEPWRETLYPGMEVSLNSLKVVKAEPPKYNYADDKYKFCYRVDKSCKVTQEFECGNCAGGWYSVVDNKCPQGGSKLCGISECGGHNQPACPRGQLFEEAFEGSFCFRGSKAGICHEGLETYCDGNKVLVCR